MGVRRVVTSLVAFGIVVCVAALAGPPAGAADQGADPSQQQIRVMTFNIRHGVGADGHLDLAATADAIAAQHPDVVALQEVDRHWGARSDYVDQAAWLADRLGMHEVFGVDLDRDPPAAGKPHRQYGDAILSRYPVADSAHTLLTKDGHPETEQRGLLYAQIDAGAVTFGFYATHLEVSSDVVRQAQAHQIVAALADPTEATILAGDLNATPGSPTVATLTAAQTDAWAAVGSDDGDTFPAADPTERIDYVLTGDGTTPDAAAVPTGTASNHRPVVVDATLD